MFQRATKISRESGRKLIMSVAGGITHFIYIYIYVYDVWLYDGICMYVRLQMKQSQQGQLDKWFSVVRIRRGWSFIKPTITTICPTWSYHVFCVKEQGGFRHRYVVLAKKMLSF